MANGNLGYFILASAIVWSAVIIGCAVILKGTSYYNEISPVLTGGMLFHLLFIWGPLGALSRKKKAGKSGE